jgi:serine/threonine protein kinase
MLQPQQRLGDFEIIRLLGKGGMGEVYEAQQFHPERRVALKVLAPWLADNEQALRRFWQEANVPAKLDHPSIVRIIQTDKVDKIAYYTMQLVQGIALSDLMRSASKSKDPLDFELADSELTESNGVASAQLAETVTARLPEPSVVEEYRRDRFTMLARIGSNAARALDSAHRQGFLHRDIKPSNLMVDHHNQLYLVDFGLTRALDSTTGTRAGTVIGTPWFMSPEQAHGHPLDARSDIFSLGVTLYQLATGGKGPYQSRRGDTDAILREVRSGTLKPVRELAPETPPALERVIARATAAKPEDRYQTAAELADDLETFLASGTVPIARSSVVNRRHSRYRMIAVAALIVAVGVAIGLFRNHKEPPGNPVPQPDLNHQPFDRERPFDTKVPLLRIDNHPIEHRVLVGDGAITPLATELVLKGNGDRPFLIAIDHPKKVDFDFSVECKAFGQAGPRVADLGLFFGYRDNVPPPTVMRFFVLKLDTKSELADKYGRLYYGTWQFGPTANEQDPMAFPKESSYIPLPDPKSRKEEGWQQLQVSVRGKEFTIAVDELPARTFNVGALTRLDKRLAATSLECQGMIGLWVRNGTGHFRDATITARRIGE